MAVETASDSLREKYGLRTTEKDAIRSRCETGHLSRERDLERYPPSESCCTGAMAGAWCLS